MVHPRLRQQVASRSSFMLGIHRRARKVLCARPNWPSIVNDFFANRRRNFSAHPHSEAENLDETGPRFRDLFTPIPLIHRPGEHLPLVLLCEGRASASFITSSSSLRICIFIGFCLSPFSSSSFSLSFPSSRETYFCLLLLPFPSFPVVKKEKGHKHSSGNNPEIRDPFPPTPSGALSLLPCTSLDYGPPGCASSPTLHSHAKELERQGNSPFLAERAEA